MPTKTAINNRTATRDDVDQNTCIFFVPDNRTKPYSFGRPLPLSARLVLPEEDSFAPSGTPVQILQAEQDENGAVILGVVYCDGQEALCGLTDVELIP